MECDKVGDFSANALYVTFAYSYSILYAVDYIKKEFEWTPEMLKAFSST